MVDNKDDETGGDYASINDSGELLKSLFREEWDAIVAEKRREIAEKTVDKTSGPKMPRSPAQDKGASREKSAPQIKIATPEESIPEEGIKTKQLEGGKVRLGGNLPLASAKLKVGLLSVLVVAAVAFMLGSLGVVEFGQLLGLSEPAKKAAPKTLVAIKPPAKRSTPVATQSTEKISGNTASDKAAFPERRRIVRKRSTTPLSKARRRIIHKRAEPVTSTKELTTTQEHPELFDSVQKPVMAGQLPKPVASTQNEVIPGQPAEPATTTQEIPTSRRPAETMDPTQEPLVAKEPAEPSAPKVQPVVNKVSPRSAGQSPEEAAPGKENVFPGERDLSYPYSIYHGSYKTRERAERAISEYRIKGLYPYWVEVDLGDKGVWYRVFSGYFQEREQANEFIKQKQIGESESRHTRYANLIGLFAFQEELEEKQLQLSKLGYCPYVIPRGNSESLLCVGAFYQKVRAQRQHAKLKSKGIHSKIVER